MAQFTFPSSLNIIYIIFLMTFFDRYFFTKNIDYERRNVPRVKRSKRNTREKQPNNSQTFTAILTHSRSRDDENPKTRFASRTFHQGVRRRKGERKRENGRRKFRSRLRFGAPYRKLFQFIRPPIINDAHGSLGPFS